MEQDSQCVKKIQKKNAFFGNNDERLITLFWISFPLIAEQMTSSYIPLFFVFFNSLWKIISERSHNFPVRWSSSEYHDISADCACDNRT